jgi:hypothetical protein
MEGEWWERTHGERRVEYREVLGVIYVFIIDYGNSIMSVFICQNLNCVL